MLLTTAFLPPVEYFAAIAAEYSSFYLEACENYQKQSYRNRCYFYGANGREMIQVPVVHENGSFNLPITRIRVSYTTQWVIRAERAISSAYSSSAFFEYYRDDLFAILDSHPEKLWDLNLKLIEFFLEKCGIAAPVHITGAYGSAVPVDIHPKRPNTVLRDLGLEKPYFQVFSQKHGFIPNLSIMDLLFNEGPDAISYLRNGNRK